MNSLNTFLTEASDFLWGLPLLIALVGTGAFLTLRLGFVQVRHMPRALKMIFVPPKDTTSEGEISHFQALMTALAATVGTGNIAGVSTAIALGGPGAMLWMWITGLVGMATKYAEAILAVHYREVHPDGIVAGGPMYYIEKGLGSRWFAAVFALCTSIAAFGTGNMIQSNSVAEIMHGTFQVSHAVTGAVITFLAGLVVIGGIRSIGRVTQVIVPFMIVLYMGAGITAILLNVSILPLAIKAIFVHAFTGRAIFGGIAGAGMRQALRQGLAKGLLSNESGLGSSPIVAAAARTDHPVTQSLVSMTQTFIDTLVVCSMTGFIVIMAQASGEGAVGVKLTAHSFDLLLGSSAGGLVTALSLAFFAFSTILGWCYYGEKAVEYLAGSRMVIWYRIVFVCLVFVGAITRLETVWNFSEVMNALMALPNLIALVLLSGVVKKLHREYFSGRAAARADSRDTAGNVR